MSILPPLLYEKTSAMTSQPSLPMRVRVPSEELKRRTPVLAAIVMLTAIAPTG